MNRALLVVLIIITATDSGSSLFLVLCVSIEGAVVLAFFFWMVGLWSSCKKTPGGTGDQLESSFPSLSVALLPLQSM